MTASSGIDLRARLELLARLQQTVADFAKREEKLAQEVRARRASANRFHREAAEKTEAWLAGQTEEAEVTAKEDVERVRAIFERRRARIERLHSAGVRSVAKRAHDARERWMGDLQMKRFQTDRKRTAALKAADTALQEYIAQLAVHQAHFVRLETDARKAFRGYDGFQQMLRGVRVAEPKAGGDSSDRDTLFAQLRGNLETAEEQLAKFRGLLAPRFFRYVPLPLLPLLFLAGGLVFSYAHGFTPDSFRTAGIGVVVAVFVAAASYFFARSRGNPFVRKIVAGLKEAGRLHDICRAAAKQQHAQEHKTAEEAHARTSAEIDVQWNRADEIEKTFAQKTRAKLATQHPRATLRNLRLRDTRLARIESTTNPRVAEMRETARNRTKQLAADLEAELAIISADEAKRWEQLTAEWQQQTAPQYRLLGDLQTAATLPPWSEAYAEVWQPPTAFPSATEFARLEVDIAAQAPKDPRLALPGPAQLSIPLSLRYPERGSLLFETDDATGDSVLGVLNNTILRLFTTSPPGKIALTLIDPVGLGHGFAGLMHLGDYEDSLINRRIWTQREQIDERLRELSEHIEKVIQMYLRSDYATITEYNAQAGSVAEKYHFLVLANFPAEIGESAARRLQSIVTSGPRCGIFTFMVRDRRQPLPEGFVIQDMRKHAICIRNDHGVFTLDPPESQAGAALVFEPPPDAELALKFVHRIGKASVDSNRVEVPFAQIAPASEELWTGDTTNELRVAIGRTGATKQQYLAIGKGTRQHALFAGKTGSGKSTLFHVIITNLALSCSPEQVEFYLIDFKKGVEFKCYATHRLPHARVVAIESDREFALSVLQRVDAELKRRGDMFRKLSVQDVAGYKKAGGTEPMPRSLLLIDEFQEFFVEDDEIAQTASLLFDRIVRQGRAFGIHVLLGSQTLGGAYSLARATLGQMVIRVALQCNEADAYLIMDDNNSAPRLLSRPGEGIYNDAAGAIEGNSPFQVVWLPDDERDVWLDKVHELADRKGVPPRSPIVFEGNAPADLRENDLFRAVLQTPPASVPAAPRFWLGAPNSIKGPTEAVLHRQSGNHVLIVGQREEAASAMLALAMLALAAQHPLGAAKFYFIHAANPGSAEADLIDRIVAAIPHGVRVARAHEIGEAMSEIGEELKTRSAGGDPDNSNVFVFIHGLQKFKKLRQEDDFSFSSSDSDAANPGAQLTELITEGSSHGMHLIVTVDTFNNVNRAMNRKALSEFEMRVVFQMSANDSASLIDSPKASGLGLHRALFHNEQAGTTETFRPYATPDAAWLDQAAAQLAARRPASQRDA